MKRKRAIKLSLHRETVRSLEGSELPAALGAESGNINCIKTFPYSICGGTCNLTCKTCFDPTCFPRNSNINIC